MHGFVRPFCPAHAVHKLTDVDTSGLANRGIKLILIDVDNTLVKWRSMDFAQETLDWVEGAKRNNLQVCIISNTRNVTRLGKLSEILGIPAMRGKFKPSTAMYKEALVKFGVRESEAVMIGDQLFTDILGANRAGIEAIWIQPLTNVDFAPTKINRFMERMLRGYLYRALSEPPDATPEPEEVAASMPFIERKVVRQFVKFCIVGGTSFVIDYCINMSLMYLPAGDSIGARIGRWLMTSAHPLFGHAESPLKAAMPVVSVISASFAIVNSFYWNRLWTFKITGIEERAAQFRRFVVISVVGLVLNVALRSAFFHLMPTDAKAYARIAFVASAVIVAFWNFFGQRIYAFKAHRATEEVPAPAPGTYPRPRNTGQT